MSLQLFLNIFCDCCPTVFVFLFVMILMTGTISSLCSECHLDTDQSPLHSPHHIPPAQVTQVPSLHTSILSLSYFHFRTFKISLSYFHFRALTSQFCIHITIVSASTSYTGTFSFNLFPSLRFPPDFQTSNLLSKHASTSPTIHWPFFIISTIIRDFTRTNIEALRVQQLFCPPPGSQDCEDLLEVAIFSFQLNILGPFGCLVPSRTKLFQPKTVFIP